MTHATKTLRDSDATKPIGMVGAGRLTSMIWKTGDDDSCWRYRFNLFRTGRRGSRVSQMFAPADVIHFVKLAQVLAAVLADDGCLDPIERGVLKRLAHDLDQFWTRFPKPSKSTTGFRASSNNTTAHSKGTTNGDSPDL